MMVYQSLDKESRLEMFFKFFKSYRNLTSLKEENLNLKIAHLIGYYNGTATYPAALYTVLLPGPFIIQFSPTSRDHASFFLVLGKLNRYF